MDENLHSYNKLKKTAKGLELLTSLIFKSKNKDVKDINREIEKLERLISLFQHYFSDLGWCLYDSINVSLMQEAIAKFEAEGIDAGEKVLLQYYKSDVKDELFLITYKAKPFSDRYNLIQKAFEDHFARRYYASIPLFLIISDGAINDYTKSKGFFAEGTNLTAWDCLVGCNDSLAKMQKIFNQKRTKTNHDEIRLPYRNGILHGRDLNYANEYVSCKCVSLLFALADWMNMKDSEEQRKERFEQESNPPSIIDSFKKMWKINSINKEQKEWTSKTIVIGKDISLSPSIDECIEYPYIVPLIKAFDAWGKKNYGTLSKHLEKLFDYETSEKKRAGECRKLFASKEFRSFKLKEIEERACSLTRILVQVEWTVENKNISEPLEFGIVYQSDDKNDVAVPWRNNGEWKIVPWKVHGLYKYQKAPTE